jgi:hypothetical protein
MKKVVRFFGTHAYIINRKGINKILQHEGLFPITKQLDSELSVMCIQGKLNVYACEPGIILQDNSFVSSIQMPLKTPEGEDPWSFI